MIGVDFSEGMLRQASRREDTVTSRVRNSRRFWRNCVSKEETFHYDLLEGV